MQSFLTACGLVEPLQIVVASPTAEGEELRLLHQPFALIGRNSRADLVLEHARVSRRHVYVQVIEGRTFWVDLESRTGTRVDGELRKHGWLMRGEQALCIGPYSIRRIIDKSQTGNGSFGGEQVPVAPFVAPAYSGTPSPEVALEFLNGPSQATTWPVRRVMSFIGSAVGCKFRLTDPSVSRFHASFLRTSEGFWIVDLLGQGGVTVNEVPVRFGHLADGDLIAIGRYQIRVRCRPARYGSGGRPSDHSAKGFAEPRRRERSDGRKLGDNWAAAKMPFLPGTELANLAQFPLALSAFSAQPKPEIITSENALTPLKLAPVEATESLLVPLVNQFGVMQQQMFDQFQQAMVLMLQMFGTMHHEQMEVIRGELDQLHDLTQEVRSLRDELAIRTREEDKKAPADVSAGAFQGPEESVEISKGPEDLLATERSTSVPVTTETFEGMTNARSKQTDTALTGSAPLSGPRGPEHERLVVDPAAHPSARGLRAPVPAPPTEQPVAPSRGKTDGSTSPGDSERDSIAWLHHRIIALQRERETRWQKILKLLPGIS